MIWIQLEIIIVINFYIYEDILIDGNFKNVLTLIILVLLAKFAACFSGIVDFNSLYSCSDDMYMT